ncbi:MAG: hypothetical protein GF330_08280, partial [Candidatus Eisenbacteria bacterium]|nr:hypothetical protein [Candidatus Eisenbacteria bacterium]
MIGRRPTEERRAAVTSAGEPRAEIRPGCGRAAIRADGLLGALLLGLLLQTGCDSEAPEGFIGSGILEAETTLLSAQASGELLELRVEEGQQAAAGDTLAV